MALILSATPGCSDDDTKLIPLDQPELTVSDALYNSLTFHWDKVKGARQYYYEFAKAGSDDIIESGLTKSNSLSFGDLVHDTEYTLKVLAYAAIESDNTTSEPKVLTGRTADLTSIESPVVSQQREVNTLIFTWDAVTNARDYEYTFTDSEGNDMGGGSTFSTSVSFSDLQTDKYTFTVVARTIEDGMRDSAPATLTVDFVREHVEIWRLTTPYSSALLGESWDVTLVAYDDNAFTLLDWYGEAGYDFSFTIDTSDSDDMFKVDQNVYAYDSATGAYAVPTGIESMPTVYVTASGNQSAFEGNSGKGSIDIKVSDGTNSGYDSMIWGLSIEDFVGEWTFDWKFLDAYGETEYDEYGEKVVSITLGSEPNTLVVPMPGYSSNPGPDATMVVDLSSMTFTMAPLRIGSYTLAGADSEAAQITGTLSGNQIKFGAFQMWYSGWTWIADDSVMILTRN